jgi:hypothetical protein
LKELLKLHMKTLYNFFVPCLVREIFWPKTVCSPPSWYYNWPTSFPGSLGNTLASAGHVPRSKFSARGGAVKVSNYMLPVGYYVSQLVKKHKFCKLLIFVYFICFESRVDIQYSLHTRARFYNKRLWAFQWSSFDM